MELLLPAVVTPSDRTLAALIHAGEWMYERHEELTQELQRR